MKMSRCSFLIPLTLIACWLIAFTATGRAATVAAPVFNPPAGNYTTAQTVAISTTTSGASIRYTIDGSTPSDTVGTVYSGPVTGARQPRLRRSPIQRFDEQQCGNGGVSHSGGDADVQSGGRELHDGANGGDQHGHGGSGDPLHHRRERAERRGGNGLQRAGDSQHDNDAQGSRVCQGLTNSSVATAVCNILAATPTFSPAGGNYTTAQTVAISTATAGAPIRYTIDGSTPSDTVGTVYSGPVTVSATTTLKAVAYSSGLTNSSVATAVYNILVATPNFSPAGGNCTTAQTVAISTATAGAAIRYTIDGSTPSDTVGTVYSGPVTVSATTTLKAVAYASGLTNSGVATAVYNILVATPSFSPAGGNYTAAQTVTISTATAGAAIRYTTDGSTPSDTVGKVYSGPVTVNATTTLKAVAYASSLTNSSVATAVYNILAATPSFSPAGGNYMAAQTVTISTATAGAAIRYTTDGSTPSDTVGTVYSGPVTVSATTTLKAIAYASGLTNSSVATAVYNILVATPSFSPAGGNYLRRRR